MLQIRKVLNDYAAHHSIIQPITLVAQKLKIIIMVKLRLSTAQATC